jgi:hypothetical protein
MGLYVRAFKGYRENIWHLPCMGGDQLNWRSVLFPQLGRFEACHNALPDCLIAITLAHD